MTKLIINLLIVICVILSLIGGLILAILLTLYSTPIFYVTMISISAVMVSLASLQIVIKENLSKI
jgi:hypothetical protein